MKNNIKKILLLLLSFLFLIGNTSCSAKAKTMMSIEKDGIRAEFSVNLYELMLSRAKGNLAITAGSAALSDPDFWNYTDKFDGETVQTRADYVNGRILESCKCYLAALWLFDKNGLTLNAAANARIDEILKEYTETDGNGSETALNSILSQYGANTGILREALLLEEKIGMLKTYLYGDGASLVGDAVKEDYFESEYLCFDYYRYDPYRVTGENEDGEEVTEYLSEEVLTAQTERVLALMELSGEAQDEALAAEKEALNQGIYPGGAGTAYLPRQEVTGTILDDIKEELLLMEEGDLSVLSDADGRLFLFRKMPIEAGAYREESYADLFEDFADNLIDSLFTKECEKLFDAIEIDEKILDGAPGIKEAGINYYY